MRETFYNGQRMGLKDGKAYRWSDVEKDWIKSTISTTEVENAMVGEQTRVHQGVYETLSGAWYAQAKICGRTVQSQCFKDRALAIRESERLRAEVKKYKGITERSAGKFECFCYNSEFAPRHPNRKIYVGTFGSKEEARIERDKTRESIVQKFGFNTLKGVDSCDDF